MIPTVWSGTANWSSTANWSLNALPTASNVAQISSGTVTVDASTTFTVGAIELSGGILAGGSGSSLQLVAAGSSWSGGTMNGSGSIVIGSGATFGAANASNNDFNQRVLVNDGTFNWTSGQLRSGNGGSFTNNSIFNDSASNSVNAGYGGAMTFTNAAAGTYHKTAAGTTTYSITFNNDGLVNVDAGTLVLGGGGTTSSTGTFAADAGTTVRFDNSYTVADATKLQGAGQYQLAGGTLTLTGTVNATNFLITGGTLAGSQTFANGATWTGGNLDFAGTTTNASGSTFALSNASQNDFNQRAIVNDGTANWTSGQLRSGNGGSFTNNSIFNDTASNSVIAAYGGAMTFTNAAAGTYNKTAAGTTTYSITFNNDGLVNVDAGTLVLGGGGTTSATGTFAADAGTTVRFDNSYTVADATKLQGAGQYQLAGGTLTLTGTVNAANFLITGGTLAGTQTFANGFTWSAGNLNGAGTTTNASGSTMVINTTADHDFNSRAIVNNGTVNWQAGRMRSGNGGSFTNNSVFNDSASSDSNNDYGGTAWVFTNAAGATYNKTAAGTTRFFNTFNNDGLLNVAVGTFTPISTFTLASTSVLGFGLGGTTAGTDHGLLSLSTALVLSGNLQLYFTGGFETSVLSSDLLTIATAGSVTGSFTNVTNGGRLFTNDGLGSFQVNYGTGSAFAANSVVLSNFVAVPEPSTWALLLLGGGVVVLTLRRRRT